MAFPHIRYSLFELEKSNRKSRMKILQAAFVGCTLITLAQVVFAASQLDGIELTTQLMNQHCQSYLYANKQKDLIKGYA